MRFAQQSSARFQSRGFGLVEIMVAMVIGLFATIAVMEIFYGSEARGRNTTSSAETQNTGVLTFYQLQTHIRRAGYGFEALGMFNCAVSWTLPVANGGAAISKSIFLAPVSVNPKGGPPAAPVDLLPAGDAGTDTLLVIYGTSNGQPQGNKIFSISGTDYTVQSPGSFAAGDRVLSIPGAAPQACGSTVYSIDRVVGVTATAVKLNAGGGAGAVLFNLGRGPIGANDLITINKPSNGLTALAYAVRGGELTVCDFTVNDCGLAANAGNNAIWVPIVRDIVGFRAVYWKDTSAAWDGSSSASDQARETTSCGVASIRALSVVLVVRNPEREKGLGPNEDIPPTTSTPFSTTPNAPTWDQVAVAPLIGPGTPLGPNAASNEEWMFYRYKTYQMLIPLRNISSMDKTGC